MSEVSHDASGHRFNVTVDGHLAYIEYEPGDGRITITHTIVPPEIGGRGIAGHLVRAALEYARDQHLSVVPQCTYADAWMRRHLEFDGLRA